MSAPRGTAEVAAIVHDAHDAGRALRIAGAGTWLGAGHRVHAAAPLPLAAISGVVSYEPGDLTMTVEAGTTLAELDEVTRHHGQWCPLLPWGDDRGTVGATVATATTGPFAATLGHPRDLVLGLDAVDGTGRVISAGGRVVKNVAGFDLTRAFTGSWGTLAVITRLHLRLRARPAVDETWALETGDTRDFRRGPLAPLACEPLSASEATALGVAGAAWLVRIGGNTSFVAAARAALRALGDTKPLDTRAWDTLRAARDPVAPAAQWRWDALSRRLKATFDPRRVLNPGLLGDAA